MMILPQVGSRLAYGTSRPCSYYDRGIKVQTRVGQNSLMFELLPVHGSLSMPTVKRLRLLPGVTTLFRDFYRRPILGASNHFL